MSKPPMLLTSFYPGDKRRPKIAVDREIWEQFKKVCKDQYGMSASAMLREFIIDFVEKS